MLVASRGKKKSWGRISGGNRIYVCLEISSQNYDFQKFSGLSCTEIKSTQFCKHLNLICHATTAPANFKHFSFIPGSAFNYRDTIILNIFLL